MSLHIINEPISDVLLPTHIPHQYRHGLNRTPTHAAWNKMVQKCRNPRNPEFVRFGAKGIGVCFKWLSFRGFLADMGTRPLDCRRLVLIDGTKDFEPGNCEWR